MPVDERVYFDKLDLLFDALVLMYGLDDLIKIDNVEKFKKEIRVNKTIFSFIQNIKIKLYFLKQITYNILNEILNLNPRFDLFGGYLTGCFDSIIVKNLNEFQVSINFKNLKY